MVLQLSEFADFGGHEKLSNALLTVQDILFDMEFNAPKKQSVIGDYFSSTCLTTKVCRNRTCVSVCSTQLLCYRWLFLSCSLEALSDIDDSVFT